MAQQVSLDIIARQPSGDNNALTSCPYLTNVGATKVYPGKTVFDPESAVVDPAGHPYRNAFSSGGGFSNIYGIPSYQEKAVAKYGLQTSHLRLWSQI